MRLGGHFVMQASLVSGVASALAARSHGNVKTKGQRALLVLPQKRRK